MQGQEKLFENGQKLIETHYNKNEEEDCKCKKGKGGPAKDGSAVEITSYLAMLGQRRAAKPSVPLPSLKVS